MSAVHWIQTIIEVLMIGIIAVGFLYEPAMTRWEEKLGEKMLKAFNKRKEYRR